MYNKAELENLRTTVGRNFTIYQSKFDELNSASSELITLRSDFDKLNLLTAYFNKIVDSKRKEIIDKVINLVSFGLQTVLEDSTVRLMVSSKIQRNQKFYSFTLEQNGRETSIVNAVGGGVINLLSFLLHVVLLAVSSNRKILILDEPFSAVSENYRENIGEFLKLLAEKTNIQFIIVSHQNEINEAADVLYNIRSVNGEVKYIRTK